MAIKFIRMDDRIIHGQVVTRWTKEIPCDGIIAVDDYSAENEFLRNSLKSASTKKTLIFTKDQFVQKYEEAQKSSKNYFLITKNIYTMRDVLNSIDTTELPKKINVGPQSSVANVETVNVNRNADLTRDEIEIYEEVYQKGFEIEFRLVPDSTPVLWSKVREKLIK